MQRLKIAIVSLFLSASFPVIAQFSDAIDLEFGMQGVLTKTFETDFTPVQLAVLENDEILVLGRANYGDDYFTIVKFNANGQSMVPGYGLFNGFSQYGSSIGGVVSNLRVTDMAALADGSAIVIGTSFNITTSKNELFAMKLNPQGQKDVSFGTDGITHIGILNFNNDPIHATGSDIAIGANGEIFIAGAIVSSQIVVAKLLPNGQRDASFGINGIVKQDHPFRPQGDRVEVELFSDGRVCVASASEIYPNGFQFPDLAPVFYTFLPNGDIDPNFIQGVRVLSRDIDLGNGNSITVEYEDFFPGEMRINSNDIVFLAGATRDDDEETIDFGSYLISVLPNGQYNTNIAVNPLFDTLITEQRISVPGMISLATSLNYDDYVSSFQLLANETMLLLGAEYSSDGDFSMAKFVDNTGNPIVTYGNQSVFRYQHVVQNVNEGFLASGIQSNGEIVALSPYSNEQGRKGMYLTRLGETGALGNGYKQNDSDTFIIYPNPVSDVLSIRNSSNISMSEILVRDVSGKLIFTTKDAANIDVSYLHHGIYFLEIHTGNSIHYHKIIRN